VAKALSRFAGDQPDEPAPPSARTWTCVAHGCPATAGIDAGGGDVICRFHHGAAPTEWGEITRRLKAREWMVRAADYCARGDVNPGWVRRAAAAAEAHGHPELSPTVRKVLGGVMRDEREHAILYAQRLNSVLAHECTIKRQAPIALPRSRSDGDAVKVGDVLPAL